MLRQFRCDSDYLLGNRNPWLSHVYFDAFSPGKLKETFAVDHVLLKERYV